MLTNRCKMAESALQLFSRLGVKEKLGNLDLPFFSSLFPEGHGLKPGDVIEFCGTEGTGKSEILLNIAARCVLPKLIQGGKESEVVFISTDHKFDLQRLTTLIEGHIIQRQSTPHCQNQATSDTEYKERVLSCLSRVHVVHCSSSTELSVTLQYLKTFLHNHSRVCALILDNVAGFYWLDKDKNETSQQQWILSLKELILEYHLVVFAAKPLLFHRPMARSRESKVDKLIPSNDFMPKLWQKMVKHRFHLERSQLQTNDESSKVLFIAHQTAPFGAVIKFDICESGLVFSE